MLDLLLIVLPVLTSLGCAVIVANSHRRPYTRFFFSVLGLAFLWLFIGEFSLQYLHTSILADRFIRGLPIRLAIFIATWVFAIAARLRDQS